MPLISNYLSVGLAAAFALSSASIQLSAQQSTTRFPEAPSAPPVMLAGQSWAEQAPDDSDALQSSSSSSPQQETGGISGTVTDLNGDLVPGAIVTLDGPLSSDHRQTEANDYAGFAFNGLRGGTSYRITVRLKGFVTWNSPDVKLAPGQYVFLSDVALNIAGEPESVTVNASTEQIAVEQVRIAEQQRVLGFIPKFYVVYDSKNAVPLTPKLKFKLALRVSSDPISMAGVMSMAAIKQAANTPDYVQGAKGYGQRLGAIAADSFSDIMIGGAILPSLLHQDPRYFYQGTGTTQSRFRHAIFSPFICKGDNGRWQPNYSSLGGDLASSAISNTYYPQSNRGPGLVFGNFAIGTVERMLSAYAQEFILRKFTPALNDSYKQTDVDR